MPGTPCSFHNDIPTLNHLVSADTGLLLVSSEGGTPDYLQVSRQERQQTNTH